MSFLSPITRRLNLTTKLTLSYTVVTIVPLLLVEVLSLFVVFVVTVFISVLPVAISMGITLVATQLRPYVASSPPDAVGAQHWLQTYVQMDASTSETTGLYLLDADRALLAQAPDPDPANPNPPRIPGLEDLVALALSGVTDPANLHQTSAQGVLTVVAPIHDRQNKIAGFLVLTMPFLSPADLYQQIMTGIGQNLIVVTLLAGLISTALGYLTVRSLTRRLKTIAQTASAWGQGDFVRLNADPSLDEIGQLARQLNQMAEELQTFLKTKQDLTALEERNRLARDLHDSAKQQVFAITMQLGAARTLIEQNPAAAKTHLLEAEQLAQKTRDELSLLIQELRPAGQVGKSLPTALREYVRDWSRQTQIANKVDVQGEERPLAANVEQTLLRVTQESLSNVARHSQATRLEVTLNYIGETVTLTVADNGLGFDPALVKKGVGLDSMRERLESIGGSLSVEAGPGSGTRVTASTGKKGTDS